MKRKQKISERGSVSEMAIVDTFTKLIFGEDSRYSNHELMIIQALRMVDTARRLGLKVMMGSMSESTIGSAAIAQLAPLVDHLDNDGTLLLDGDVATGLRVEDGRLLASGRPGLGVQVHGLP